MWRSPFKLTSRVLTLRPFKVSVKSFWRFPRKKTLFSTDVNYFDQHSWLFGMKSVWLTKVAWRRWTKAWKRSGGVTSSLEGWPCSSVVIWGKYYLLFHVAPQQMNWMHASNPHTCGGTSKYWGWNEARQFAANLLQVGNGSVPADEEGRIKLDFLGTYIVHTQEELITAIYPNIETRLPDPKWLAERVIMAPKNESVHGLNNILIDRLPGELKVYKSIDTTVEVNDACHFPSEVLNRQDPPGLPQHELKIKVGCPIMLLRNLDAPKMVNGTRLTVRRLFPNCILAEIITGDFAGEEVFIPRISLQQTNYLIEFKGLQFPVRVCYTLTSNKAQGIE